MWQKYENIDFALEGAPTDVLESLPVACHHLTPMPDAPAPDGFKFSIDALRTQPIDATIPLFSDADMTAAHFYNALCELAYADGKCSMSKVREIVDGIAEFVAAIMYDRWAISSDLNLERALVDKIEDVYARNDLANSEIFAHREPECDYNEAHFIFDAEDLLSEWIVEIAVRALNALSMNSSSIASDEDDLCYFSGALYKGSLPCFKASGFSKMQEKISFSMMELLYAIEENDTTIAIFDMDVLRDARQGTGVSIITPPMTELVSEPVMDAWRKTGIAETSDGWGEEDGWWSWDAEEDDRFSDAETRISFSMDDACVVFFDSTCEGVPEQVGFIAALGLLGELPDGCKRVLAVQVSKDARSVRLVNALLEGYGLEAVTAIGLGVEWCADVYDMLSPNIIVPVPTLRPDDYRYMGKWSEGAIKSVVDAYAAACSVALAYSIVTAANEARGFSDLISGTGSADNGARADASSSLDATTFLNPEENISPEWVRLMIRAATGGLINPPEYDSESVRANYNYGMMYLKKLYQTEHAELVQESPYKVFANGDYHDPSLDKLYAISDIYNKYGVFADNYRTIVPSDNAQPMTRESAIGAGEVVWQMAQGADADLAIHAVADGVPLSDVLA